MTKLYEELAEWWPLLSSPDEYAEEATFFRQLLNSSSAKPPRTVLELGSGGGNNAFHLSPHFAMTLVEISPQMLAVSRGLNPLCEHVQGDMRSIRLGRTFDAVFVHDAIMYMTTESDLRDAMRTAYEHCAPGGSALFVPDYVHETYVESSDHGGSDADGRALRYLDWTFDPDPGDNTFVTDYAIMLRYEKGDVRVVYDRHIEGLFSREVWIRLLREVGFEPTIVPDRWDREIFICHRS